MNFGQTVGEIRAKQEEKIGQRKLQINPFGMWMMTSHRQCPRGGGCLWPPLTKAFPYAYGGGVCGDGDGMCVCVGGGGGVRKRHGLPYNSHEISGLCMVGLSFGLGQCKLGIDLVLIYCTCSALCS